MEQSHIFISIYWQRYGWVAPGEEVSGLEDEYLLCGPKPKLIYVKTPAPEREARLQDLLARIRDDDSVSYKPFASAAELQRLLADDLALLLTERFEATAQPPQTVTAPPPAPQANPKRTAWPLSPNPLIGREHELAFLTRALEGGDARLITLLGPGGIGKSRLALALAEAAAPAATFIDLAGLNDPELVVPTIADALGIPETEGESRLDGLQRALQGSATLLLLDNFEQVVAAAPDIGALLAGCPDLKMIVTSRAPLRLSVEREVPVLPLGLPPRDAPLALLREAEAVQLFAARAQAVKPTFTLTMTNAPAVAELTRRLDGLPLALELAAARIRLLSPADLLRRLDRRFELLSGGARDLPSRQRTLRSTIDWSFTLLTPEERRVLPELAVFAGSWSLSAAEAVCNPAGAEAFLDALTVLVDNNLVAPYDTPEETRFRLLESIRAYALEKLEGSGAAQLVRTRHAEYFLAFAEEGEGYLEGSEGVTWLDRLEAEHDNFRAALAWTFEQGLWELNIRLANALCVFWWRHSHFSEGRKWLLGALANFKDVSELRAQALNGAGVLTWLQGDYQTTRTLYQEALGIYRTLENHRGISSVLGNLAVMSLEERDYASAKALTEEVLELNKAFGFTDRVAVALVNLSLINLHLGDYSAARTNGEESLDLFRQQENQWGCTTALINLGGVMSAQGEYQLAQTHFGESLQLAQGLGDKESVAYALEGFASVAAAQGQAKRAARLGGAAEGLRESIGNPRPPSSGATDYELDMALMRGELGETAFAEIWTQGRTTPLEQTIMDALETPSRLPTDTSP